FHKVFEISVPELSSGHAIVDDLDRDGRPEIIFCTCGSTVSGPDPGACPVVHIWENTGDNQYSEVFSALLPATIGPYISPWRLVAGDIDGDGAKELLVVRVGGGVDVLTNVGDNAYVTRPDVDAQLNAGRPWAQGPVTAFVTDMNGDGQPEIGFVDSPSTPTPGNTSGNLFLYQHTGPPGQQTYEPALSKYFEVWPLFLTDLWWSAVGDSDNDGFPEVVVGTLIGGAPIQRIQWNPSLGTYEWTHTVPDYPARGGLPFVADVDGD